MNGSGWTPEPRQKRGVCDFRSGCLAFKVGTLIKTNEDRKKQQRKRAGKTGYSAQAWCNIKQCVRFSCIWPSIGLYFLIPLLSSGCQMDDWESITQIQRNVNEREKEVALTYDPVSSFDAHLPHGGSEECDITPQLSVSHLDDLLICLSYTHTKKLTF